MRNTSLLPTKIVSSYQCSLNLSCLKLMNFQIDWTQKEGIMSGSVNIYCTCGHGTVIGLRPNSDYLVNVEVFSTAGTGTPSEKYLVKTYEWRKLRGLDTLSVAATLSKWGFVCLK